MKEKIYISPLAGKKLIDYLKKQHFEIFFTKGSNNVYEEIALHTDIYMCQTGLWENADIFLGDISLLKRNYPGNIPYNALCTGKYFIHNLKYTSPELLKYIDELYVNKNIIKINVPQGYTRCTCLPVDDCSFITSDRGIANALSSFKTDVLLIESGYIKLPGFNYGFIGGTAGNLIIDGHKTIVFNGNLSEHPDFKKITAFIKDRNIDIVYFKEYPLEDIGSILTAYKNSKD